MTMQCCPACLQFEQLPGTLALCTSCAAHTLPSLATGGSNSSVDAASNAPGGFKLATTSLIPGNAQHAARTQQARAMLDSDAPLGPKPLGPATSAWVFLVQANVVTGPQTTPLYGTHLLVTAATALNATHARATALAFPSDA